MVVLARVQHDPSAADALQSQLRSHKADVSEAPVQCSQVPQISEVPEAIVRSAVPMDAVRVVVPAHAGTAVGGVSALVHMKAVQAVAHSVHTHVANLYFDAFESGSKEDLPILAKGGTERVHSLSHPPSKKYAPLRLSRPSDSRALPTLAPFRRSCSTIDYGSFAE